MTTLYTLFPSSWPLGFRGLLFLLLIASVLHTLDRQGEYASRTDFLWKAKLKVEQEEVETMRGINKVTKYLPSSSSKCDVFAKKGTMKLIPIDVVNSGVRSVPAAFFS